MVKPLHLAGVEPARNPPCRVSRATAAQMRRMRRRRRRGTRQRRIGKNLDPLYGEAGGTAVSSAPRPTTRGGKAQNLTLVKHPQLRYYWSNEPRLKEILRRTSSHSDCREHLKKIEDIHVADDEDMNRLCLYQEQELTKQAHFTMNR